MTLMGDELFQDLLQSVSDMNKIMRSELEPSRTFIVERSESVMNLDAVTFTSNSYTSDIGDALREAGEYLARCQGYLCGVQYNTSDCGETFMLFISDHVPPPDDYTYVDALRKQIQDQQAMYRLLIER